MDHTSCVPVLNINTSLTKPLIQFTNSQKNSSRCPLNSSLDPAPAPIQSFQPSPPHSSAPEQHPSLLCILLLCAPTICGWTTFKEDGINYVALPYWLWWLGRLSTSWRRRHKLPSGETNLEVIQWKRRRRCIMPWSVIWVSTVGEVWAMMRVYDGGCGPVLSQMNFYIVGQRVEGWYDEVGSWWCLRVRLPHP